MRKFKVSSMAHKELKDIAKFVNPKLNGWINYFGKFYRTETYRLMEYFDTLLARWAMKKFKSKSMSYGKAHKWIYQISKQQPKLFPHWKMKAKF